MSDIDIVINNILKIKQILCHPPYYFTTWESDAFIREACRNMHNNNMFIAKEEEIGQRPLNFFDIPEHLDHKLTVRIEKVIRDEIVDSPDLIIDYPYITSTNSSVDLKNFVQDRLTLLFRKTDPKKWLGQTALHITHAHQIYFHELKKPDFNLDTHTRGIHACYSAYPENKKLILTNETYNIKIKMALGVPVDISELDDKTMVDLL